MPIYPALQVRPPSIDLPGAMQAAQDFRTGQSRNRLVEGQLGQLQQRAQARREYAPGALAGNQDALQSLAAIDPDGAAQLQQIVGTANDQQRAELEEQNLEHAQMAVYIENSPNELTRNSRWTEVRSSVGDEMPESFDPEWIAMQKARIRTVKQLLDQGQGQQPQAGFRSVPGQEGAVEPIPGGPASEEHLRMKAEATRAPPRQQQLALERKLQLAGIDPESEQGRALILADVMGQQIEIDEGPEGMQIRIGKGAAGAGAMSKPTRTKLESKQVSAREGLARLDQIQSGFQEKFQEIPYRVGTAVSALKEKFRLGTVTEEEQAELYEYTQFTRDAIENINLYIKDITGAQMAVSEAARLTRGMPNPGDGIFTGDSPTEFQAKMDSVVSSLRSAAARNAYALQNGLFSDLEGEKRAKALERTIPLGSMEKIMNDRAAEIRAEIRAANPNIESDALDDQLRSQLAEEFGLTGF